MEVKPTQALETPNDAANGETDGGKTFTQDNVNTIVAERLAKEKAHAEADKKQAVAEAKAEAERLATLSQEEKQKELTAKYAVELAEKERNITLRENELNARAKLEELNLPTKFAQLVINVDTELMNKQIEVLKDGWDKAVTAQVAKQLAGNPPKDFSKGNTDTTPKKVINSF